MSGHQEKSPQNYVIKTSTLKILEVIPKQKEKLSCQCFLGAFPYGVN